MGDQVGELNKAISSETENRKKELSDVWKELLYLEAYSRRENLKFEGIEEQLQQANGEEKEDTKAKLVDFMQNILGIDDAHEIEFQRVHRMGRRPKEGVAGRPIIPCFLRYPDRERVFKCGRKLKDTAFKMYEDISRDLQNVRRSQIKILKEARGE